jgi:hypothetical protein
MPTGAPSSSPTISAAPSSAPTISQAPTISTEPTPGPTERQVFEDDFIGRDIGAVAHVGLSLEDKRSPGLYMIQGGGSQIFVSCVVRLHSQNHHIFAIYSLHLFSALILTW